MLHVLFDLAKELTFTKITTHTRTLISMVPHYCLAFGPLRHLVSICLLCMDGLANSPVHAADETNYVYTLFMKGEERHVCAVLRHA